MRAIKQWALVGSLLLAAVGCGASATKAKTCPVGTAVGAMVPCDCKAGGSGTQTCQKDKTLTACTCDSGASGMSGGSAGTGGKSSTGSAGSSTGGAGKSTGSGGTSSGSGGSSSGSGGSSSGAAGGGSGTGGSAASVTPLPMTGDQLSVCTMAQGECNRGLACYSPTAPGQGFCSKICTMDSDCAGLAPSGSTYTCPPAAGFGGGGTRVCQIACTGTMDTSCPTDMACMTNGGFVGAGGAGGSGGRGGGGGGRGGGGQTPTYSCKYTTNAGMPPGTIDEWGMCKMTSECLTDLVCVGANLSMTGVGHCAKACMMTADCTAKPATGTIMPTCIGTGPMGASVCALGCGGMMMGFGGRGGGGGGSGGAGTCPDGQTCRSGMGGPSFCEY